MSNYLAGDGAFAAFWEKDDETVRFFTPSGLWETFFEVPWTEWESLKQHMAEDDRRFPDIINLARNSLALKSIFIDKSRVKISGQYPGMYHPRLWRGIYRESGSLAQYNPIDPYRAYGGAFVQSVVAAESLFSALSELFRYIEPADQNLDAFSHRNRELLILACTEVEASWRGFLDSNGYVARTSFNTTDYVKLHSIFRLKEWQVGLSDYPNTSILCPFRDWDSAQSTQSLRWYDGYNGVKHNREAEFAKASLRNVLSAMAALFVMQIAQWGPQTYDKMHFGRKAPFYLRSCPDFEPEDLYIPFLENDQSFMPRNYFP